MEAIVGVGNTELCRLPCCVKRCVAMVIGATSQDLLELLLQQYPQLQEITGMTPCYQCGRFQTKPFRLLKKNMVTMNAAKLQAPAFWRSTTNTWHKTSDKRSRRATRLL